MSIRRAHRAAIEESDVDLLEFVEGALVLKRQTDTYGGIAALISRVYGTTEGGAVESEQQQETLEIEKDKARLVAAAKQAAGARAEAANM